ncbi:MAG: hypothetical protein B6I28_01975 [Fusobacteriia bacterium 4572_132]|nr:MAG: hypothetical protein B6I28_01975 [Fusobacteriia bacterium 4572_132]
MYLEIKSEDSYGEKITQKFEAEKITYPKGIVYKYKDEYSENSIYKYSSTIKILRKGSITTNQVFKLGEKTTFFYETPYLQKRMEIKTEKMEIKDGMIKIVYKIFENNEILNMINIKIKEKR